MSIPVGLRVYPPGDVYADDPTSPRGVPSKFGWPLSDGIADRIVDLILSRAGLRLTGVHCHLGSQITRAPALLSVLEPVLDWTAGLRSRAPIERLNVGGGFGVAGIQRIKGAAAGLSSVQAVRDNGPRLSFDVAEFSSGLRKLLHGRGLGDLEVYAEPGRFLISSAAVLLTRVVSIKPLSQQTWVLLDGGLNLLPTAGVAELHTFSALRPAPEDAHYLVGGPLCYEGDVFATDAALPADLSPGDLVVIHDAGAYGFSRATSFNRLRPATVVIDRDVPKLAWRAETYQDLMRMSVS
jgi:diaminopimelate decarboxylase